MNVLLDQDELEVQQAVSEFLAAECTPQVVRAAEKSDERYARDLWASFVRLGWMRTCLPERHGGQDLPVSYLGLVLEAVGAHIAPLPVGSTAAGALAIARHGSEACQEFLAQVGEGSLILSLAIQEERGRWSTQGIRTTAAVDGDSVIVSGTKCFVDAFESSGKCIVVAELSGEHDGIAPAAIVIDSGSAGISSERLATLAKDDSAIVRFDHVRVPLSRVLGVPGRRRAAVNELMSLNAALLASQMAGAARTAMQLAVAYINQREAFGQPIGSFQAMQHLGADMLNAVDGTQLLVREALWRCSAGLPWAVEASQAKAFANRKCLFVCRSAQQMFGGLGFMAESDINLWYRRVAAWSLRGGSTYDHHARIAEAIFSAQRRLRLGDTLQLPSEEIA